MSHSRIVTAAELALDRTLWQAVERGEIKVNHANGQGDVIDVSRFRWGWSDAEFITPGQWEWQRNEFFEAYKVEPDYPLLVTVLDPVDYDPCCPANVDLLKGAALTLVEFAWERHQDGSLSCRECEVNFRSASDQHIENCRIGTLETVLPDLRSIRAYLK